MTAADGRTQLGIFTPDLLDRCMSCGYCLPACPTYALTKDEQSSPRGRITLMRALENGDLDPRDPVLLEQSSQCLGCRACEPVCPAGVQYGELLEEWRDHAWTGRDQPRLVTVLMKVVEQVRAMTWVGRLRGAVRPRRTTSSTAAPQESQESQESQQSLMLGCFERVLYPQVSRAAAEVLPGLCTPEGQGCCGALHAHNGELERGREMARELGERLPGTIVTTAGGCAAHLASVVGRERVRELSEVADADATLLAGLGTLLVDGRPARLTLQDSCHLRNALGVSVPPRDLLGRMGEYVELPGASGCCGAAGSYSLLRPRESAAVLGPKLDLIEGLGVDAVVVVNPGCYQQLQLGLLRRRSRVRAIHLAELLRLAQGGRERRWRLLPGPRFERAE